MKRSSYLTWDQLKVGALIFVALIILAFAILRLGQAGNLFGKRYHLVAFVNEISKIEGVYQTNTTIYFKVYKYAQPDLGLGRARSDTAAAQACREEARAAQAGGREAEGRTAEG